MASEDLAQELIQKSTKMGWINCDRFFDYDGPKGSFFVIIDNPNTPSVSLVFEDENAILPFAYRENNRYYFNDIPLDANVNIIAIHKNKSQNEISYGESSINTAIGSTQIELEKKTIQDLELAMSKFN